MNKRVIAIIVCVGLTAAILAFSGCGGGGSRTLYRPLVSDLDPTSGPVGTIVTATGKNFGPGKTQGSSVTFNGVEAAIINWTDTRLVVGVPDGARTGPFKVTTNQGSSSGIAFTVSGGTVGQRPYIDSVAPDSVEAGDAVTIKGSSFGDTRGRGLSGVYFNGIGAQEYISWSDTEIVAEVPIQLPDGDVSVVVATGAGSSNAVIITVVPGPPFIASVEPDSGYASTQVEIVGRNFGSEQGDSKVRFADQVAALAADTTWSDTKLTVVVPPGLPEGTVAVTVTTDRGTSNAVDFLALVSEIVITVEPDPATARLDETLQFAATVENVPEGSDDTVTWSAHPWGKPGVRSLGKISSTTGLYEAPKAALPGVTTATLAPGAEQIMATSNLDSAAVGTAIVYLSLVLDDERKNFDLDKLLAFAFDSAAYDLQWVVEGAEIRLELVNGAVAAVMDVMTLEEFDALTRDDITGQTYSDDPIRLRPQDVVAGQVIAFEANGGRYVKGQIDEVVLAGAQTGDEEVWIRFFVFEE